MMQFSEVRAFLQDVTDGKNRRNAEIVFKHYEEKVAPKLPSLEKGIIHGDCSGLNIILQRECGHSDVYKLAGIVDFGDNVYSCIIIELGISLGYIMIQNMDPVHCSSAVEFVVPLIHGYHSVRPITTAEFDCLYYLVLARCVQSALNGEHAFKEEPWNEYLLTSPRKAWMLVDMLLSTSKEEVDRTWSKCLSHECY